MLNIIYYYHKIKYYVRVFMGRTFVFHLVLLLPYDNLIKHNKAYTYYQQNNILLPKECYFKQFTRKTSLILKASSAIHLQEKNKFVRKNVQLGLRSRVVTRTKKFGDC